MIIPNKHVELYAQSISDCICRIGLEAQIDTRYELKIAERMKDRDNYIIIAVGKRNRDAETLQIRLTNQVQEMTFENFIKFTLLLTQ